MPAPARRRRFVRGHEEARQSRSYVGEHVDLFYKRSTDMALLSPQERHSPRFLPPIRSPPAVGVDSAVDHPAPVVALRDKRCEYPLPSVSRDTNERFRGMCLEREGSPDAPDRRLQEASALATERV